MTSGASYINGLGIVPLHLRGTVDWAEESFDTQLALNYTDGYKFGYVSGAGQPAVQDIKPFPTVDWLTSWDLPLGGITAQTTYN